ncbi:predicted protein [Coccidioides posadasii str. Silveira]|uniref:Predicted protein n=1 Tax=Coccidioides posadasii (strain RMSCC 757 / Silveira) TaxID=443226 RepID=E9CRR9_COCPS|nr:predicted protein [Coccidioides posadasii str. Silveira]
MNMHGTWEADFDGQLQDGKDRVERNGVELANVKDEAMLICCPTIPGFSFNKKLFPSNHQAAPLHGIKFNPSQSRCRPRFESKFLLASKFPNADQPATRQEMCDGEVLSGHKMLLVDYLDPASIEVATTTGKK